MYYFYNKKKGTEVIYKLEIHTLYMFNKYCEERAEMLMAITPLGAENKGG